MITDQKNSLVKEKQRCDKLLDKKQKNEREIRNLLKRIDATNKALEKEKSVRKKLQTELEKRPSPEPERSSRSSRPSQIQQRRSSRESTAELSLPASPPSLPGNHQETTMKNPCLTRPLHGLALLALACAAPQGIAPGRGPSTAPAGLRF